MLGNRFVFTIVAFSFLFVGLEAQAQPETCADVFTRSSSTPVTSTPVSATSVAYFEKILADGTSLITDRPEVVREAILKAFPNYLEHVNEKSKIFSSFGLSISDIFAKHDAQYAPLHVLLGTFQSPKRKAALVEKLFRSGYVLSRGSKKYPDTDDLDALMKFPSIEPLEIAVASSEKNREVIRAYFTVKDAPAWSHERSASPLETNIIGFHGADGPDYAKVVQAKIQLLKSVGADLTGILEGVTSTPWLSATSEQRVKIACRLPFDLGSNAAINHLFRETDAVSAGVTALFYAVAEKDQPLVKAYMRLGADADVVIPDQTDKTTIEHMQQMKWVSGQTIRDFARLNEIKLEP